MKGVLATLLAVATIAQATYVPGKDHFVGHCQLKFTYIRHETDN